MVLFVNKIFKFYDFATFFSDSLDKVLLSHILTCKHMLHPVQMFQLKSRLVFYFK
jgi:uncharacterized protein YigE (DUF2233 family)